MDFHEIFDHCQLHSLKHPSVKLLSEALQMPAVEEREKIDAFWFRFQFLGVGHKRSIRNVQRGVEHRKKTVGKQ